MLDVLHRSKEQRYAFDKIYRNEESQKIYMETVQPLIKTLLEGKNATVFAYGPTGTGKTYTMLGNEQIYGLNVLAIRDIFALIEQDGEFQYSVTITYVEIYNEMIRDLLVQTSGYLELRDDSDKGITIAGVTEFKAESTEQVMNLLMIGNKRRTTEATNANQTSSRSHAVFQINVGKIHRTKNINVETLSGKLSLIDLAGSERGTVTENRGLRLMQGAKINRSLLALANCINALGDKNKKGFFVPYRDSKLTRMLKDSLGGNCKTVMIVNISPANSQFQQTINTLKYANRAKNIKTKALTNKKLVSIHISEYKNIISDLRQQIEQLKTKLERTGPVNDSFTGVSPDIDAMSVVSRREGMACICGRMEQKEQIKKVKEQIFQNFNDRIQLRRALMEIEQQNALNLLEIRRKKAEVAVLRKMECSEEEKQKNQQSIKSLVKTIHTLKLSTQKNLLKKEITNLQLTESMTTTKRIKQQIPRKIKSKQNRQFLEIIIKNHVLELQNIELEINLQIQSKIILDLKNISDTQKNIMDQKGLNINLEDQVLENDDIELEIEDDQEVDGELEGDTGQADLVEQKSHENKVIQEVEDLYQDDFEQIQQQNGIESQNVTDKSLGLELKIQNFDQEEEKGKKKQQTSENNILSLGIVGLNSLKKRQNTVSDTKIPVNQKLINSSDRHSTLNKDSSNDNILDFNLKGVNLRLNQKVPFTMNPKQKKKK